MSAWSLDRGIMLRYWRYTTCYHYYIPYVSYDDQPRLRFRIVISSRKSQPLDTYKASAAWSLIFPIALYAGRWNISRSYACSCNLKPNLAIQLIHLTYTWNSPTAHSRSEPKSDGAGPKTIATFLHPNHCIQTSPRCMIGLVRPATTNW